MPDTEISEIEIPAPPGLTPDIDMEAFREPVRWTLPIVLTVVLDVVGLLALWAAYQQFHVVGAANGLGPQYSDLFLRVLVFVPIIQVRAAFTARRKNFPWTLPVWALPFTIGALFAAVWGATSMASITTMIR